MRLGEEHAEAARLRANMVNALLPTDPDGALSMAEAAWSRLRRDDVPAAWRGQAAFELAASLHAHGSDERAAELAERARLEHEIAGAAFAERAAEAGTLHRRCTGDRQR